MGFGHRVYRAYDPRAAALRQVAEGMDNTARLARPRDPGRGRRPARAGRAQAGTRSSRRTSSTTPRPSSRASGCTPDLFPATFALARHAGWTAHAIEQVAGEQAHPPGHALHRSRRARPAGLIRGRDGSRASPAAGRRRRARRAGRPSRRGSPRRRRCRPHPGTLTFIPKMLATRVSGRSTTLAAVRIRNESLSRWDRTDSFVDSRPSTTSL